MYVSCNRTDTPIFTPDREFEILICTEHIKKVKYRSLFITFIKIYGYKTDSFKLDHKSRYIYIQLPINRLLR